MEINNQEGRFLKAEEPSFLTNYGVNNITPDDFREGRSDSLFSASLPLPFPHCFHAVFAVGVDPPRTKDEECSQLFKTCYKKLFPWILGLALHSRGAIKPSRGAEVTPEGVRAP